MKSFSEFEETSSLIFISDIDRLDLRLSNQDLNMNDNKEEMSSDVESLGMSLGKRLGRLEVSGVEMVEQLVGLVERSEVVEEALVEEHIAREKIEDQLKQIKGKADGIEKEVARAQEEKVKEKDESKIRLAKLEEEQTEFMKNFLGLVESCHVMQKKLDLVEETNTKLVKEVKELQREKETLVKSLNYTSQPANSSPNMVSQTTTSSPALTPPKTVSLSSSPPMTQPPPPLGAVVRRTPLFQPPPVMFPPHSHVFFPPPQFIPNQNVYSQYQPHGCIQYPTWSEHEQ